MPDQSKPDQKSLADLALVKALFQQRAIIAHLGAVTAPPPPPDHQGEDMSDKWERPCHAIRRAAAPDASPT